MLWIVGILAIPLMLYIGFEILDFVAPEFTEKKIFPKVVNWFLPYDEFVEEDKITSPIFTAMSENDYSRVLALCDSLQEEKPLYEVDYCMFRGFAYRAMGKDKTADYWMKKALESYKGGIPGLTAYLVTSMRQATLLRDKGDYENSIKVVIPALDAIEQHSDDYLNLSNNQPTQLKGIMASDLVALGKTDEAEKIFQTAIDTYFERAKFMDIEFNYDAKVDTNYYYTAIDLDLEAAKAYLKAMQFDLATQWLEKAKKNIAQSEQYTDSVRKNRDAYLFNTQLMEAQLLTHQGKMEDAEKAYMECLRYQNANTYTGMNMRIQYLKEACRFQDILILFQKLDSLYNGETTMNIDVISQMLVPQYVAYRGMGQMPQALMIADSITQVLDNAITNARNDNAAELATIYETQKKEAQIAEQNATLSIMRLLWIIGILAVGIVIYMGYNYLRRRSEKRLAEMKAAQERIENELKIARDIQMSMVPSKFPKRNNLDMFAMMTPAKEVGGDLYGYVLNGDKLYFAVGDVSGKGVPASLFMAQATRLFRTLAAQQMMPAEICTRMNDALSGDDNRKSMFVTFFLGLIDLTTGHLSFCNAGHNPPVICGGDNNGDFLNMIPNGAIGLFPDVEYEGEEIETIRNCPLFIYTDGLNEAEDRQQKQFGNDRLLDILRHTHFDSAQQVIEILTTEVEHHRDGAEPNDDLTMMCIHVT